MRPTTPLVAMAWLRTVPGLAADRIATRLPQDEAPLRLGFLRVATVGGTPSIYVPERRPVVVIESWASPARDGSQKIPWGLAWKPIEAILAVTESFTGNNKQVDLTSWDADYEPALVQTVFPVGEPREIQDQEGSRARVDLDLQINWRRV